jgi:ABC-type Fe3+/spermidine/putrescine transport system ATPase subunit
MQADSTGAPQAVELLDVSKPFEETEALDHVTLQIRGCEFSVLAPSGCGKAPSLRPAAGFEPGSQGDVCFGEPERACRPQHL